MRMLWSSTGVAKEPCEVEQRRHVPCGHSTGRLRGGTPAVELRTKWSRETVSDGRRGDDQHVKLKAKREHEVRSKGST